MMNSNYGMIHSKYIYHIYNIYKIKRGSNYYKFQEFE